MQSIPLLIFMYFTEWLIVYSFSKSIYELRKRICILISIIFYSVLMILYGYVVNTEFFNVLFTGICNILCIYICFKSSFKSALFHGILLLIIQCISEASIIYLISHLTDTANDSYNNNITIFVMDVVLSRILFFLISRFLARFSNKETSDGSWGKWVLLSILPISSISILTTFRAITNGFEFSPKNKTLCFITISLLLLANIIVYVTYERSEKSSQKLTELELANQKNEINMQYLQLLESKNEKMNIMAHDYKNHLVAINNMYDLADVKDYINNMFDDVYKYNRMAKTKNRWLDVILNKYTDMCKTEEIRFEANVSTDNLDFINNYDISALFNNILDNAYEAALISSKKYIYIEITRVLGSYHKIIVKNSSDIRPKSQDNKLFTTKTNKESHGFGTKSIQKVVNKYDGELQWDYDDVIKEFKLVILFPDDNIV